MNRLCSIAVGALLITGCANLDRLPDVTENVDQLPAEGLIELRVDADGKIQEVEYHISPEYLPAKVVKAVDALMPGAAIDAEKEYHRDGIYYEVSKKSNGRDAEVMVHPNGKLHSKELEVPEAEIPASVLAGADRAVPFGTVTKRETILDKDGHLVEYHVKKTVDGKKYKIRLALGGKVLEVLREVPAEIEVPVKIMP